MEYDSQEDNGADYDEKESEATGVSSIHSEDFSTAESHPTIADSGESFSCSDSPSLSEVSKQKVGALWNAKRSSSTHNL